MKPPRLPATPAPEMPPDDAAWQEATSGVWPMHLSKRASGPRVPEKRLPLNRAQREARASVAQNAMPPAPALAREALLIVADTAARQAGRVANFAPAQLKELAEGRIPTTAMLDLHGLYEGDAYLHLVNWLQEASHEGHRCVLVICGKGRGYGANRDMGLLKAQLAGWLANHPAVLAFHTALPKDGGGGAVYVFLRRWR